MKETDCKTTARTQTRDDGGRARGGRNEGGAGFWGRFEVGSLRCWRRTLGRAGGDSRGGGLAVSTLGRGATGGGSSRATSPAHNVHPSTAPPGRRQAELCLPFPRHGGRSDPEGGPAVALMAQVALHTGPQTPRSDRALLSVTQPLLLSPCPRHLLTTLRDLVGPPLPPPQLKQPLLQMSPCSHAALLAGAGPEHSPKPPSILRGHLRPGPGEGPAYLCPRRSVPAPPCGVGCQWPSPGAASHENRGRAPVRAEVSGKAGQALQGEREQLCGPGETLLPRRTRMHW